MTGAELLDRMRKARDRYDLVSPFDMGEELLEVLDDLLENAAVLLTREEAEQIARALYRHGLLSSNCGQDISDADAAIALLLPEAQDISDFKTVLAFLQSEVER